MHAVERTPACSSDDRPPLRRRARHSLHSGIWLLLAPLLVGCTSEAAPLPAACLAGPQTIARALQRAPEAVTLPDGTRLSACVAHARSDAELQTLGSTLLVVADELRARAANDDRAALRLGYLAGATRRGVVANLGLAGQIGRRVEQAALLPAGTRRARGAALRRGRRIGEANG